MARVVVGLSGGVDSSVAAHLLLEQGHEVIGIFMRNWHDDAVILDDECPWIEDSNDAILVAEQLGIPFQVIDLSQDYKTRIVDYMFAEYQAGRTPNPDVLCNREIKFDLFLKLPSNSVRNMWPPAITANERKRAVLKRLPTAYWPGEDQGKDQSYFLCQLSQAQLSTALFPIGHLQKSEVRAIAAANGLATAEKKDSQGLCFIGKVNCRFSTTTTGAQKGRRFGNAPGTRCLFGKGHSHNNNGPSELEELVRPFDFDPSQGNKVGDHSGAHFFTVGQRKGLNVGGRPLPSFVLATDTAQNLIFTGLGEDHPGLFRRGLAITRDDIHWVRPDLALKEGEEVIYQAVFVTANLCFGVRLFQGADFSTSFSTKPNAV